MIKVNYRSNFTGVSSLNLIFKFFRLKYTLLPLFFLTHFSYSQTSASLSSETAQADEVRSFAGDIHKLSDGNLLIGMADMRVKKFNSSGTLINSLFQISGNDGFPASIEEYNNNIYIHAGASGYNIFNAVFDLSGNQIANNSVSDGLSDLVT